MQVAPVSQPQEAKKTEPEVKEKEKEKPKEQPKPKPKKEDDDDDLDDLEKPEKPKPNPLDLLPPSKFIMDEWKRIYSNEDTRKTALPWLWQNFDPEGYTLWFADYKYNDECEKLFMTSNLVGGFIQRLDHLRKYGFGSIIIFGQEPKLEVSGVFLFRGKEIPAALIEECDDAEHYCLEKS